MRRQGSPVPHGPPTSPRICHDPIVVQRLQRSRRAGARLPSDAIVVTRPTKWGNPHPLELGRSEAVRRFREDLLAGRLAVTVADAITELRGRDLACYCPLDEPCHADVLIELANTAKRTSPCGTPTLSDHRSASVPVGNETA
jgi:hypothetical protein